ncbi:MAG: hypothetical protein RL173_2857 [Fibrobacterota bacterium]
MTILAVGAVVAQSLAAPESKLTGGFTVNGSVLGASLVLESREINLGVKRLGFNSSGDIVLNPGVSILQRIGESGLFASGTLTLAYFYRGDAKAGGIEDKFGFLGSAVQQFDEGVGLGLAAVTIGKSWALSPRWSLDLDIGGATPMKGSDAWSGWNLVGGVGFGFRI